MAEQTNRPGERAYFEQRSAAQVMRDYAEQHDEWVDLTPKPLAVVAALIEHPDGGRFLLCRRPAHKARGGLWEFPGGKIEPGETGPQALERECREELAVQLTVGEPVAAVVHAYPDVRVRLTLYRCRLAQGVPQPLEHTELAWAAPQQVEDYDLAPADILLWQQVERTL